MCDMETLWGFIYLEIACQNEFSKRSMQRHLECYSSVIDQDSLKGWMFTEGRR